MSWKVLITTPAMAKAGQGALELLREAGCETVSPPCLAPLKRDDLLKPLLATNAVLVGAALDVYSAEPLPADRPSRGTPNLLLTPHQASYAHDTGERLSLVATQAILDLMAGRRPRFVLNPNALESGMHRARLCD